MEYKSTIKLEYKKNKKKIPLAFKEEVAMKAVANKKKLEEKPGLWNPKGRKWTKPSCQIGHKTLAVQEMFTDMKDKVNKSSDFKSCTTFVGRCEKRFAVIWTFRLFFLVCNK